MNPTVAKILRWIAFIPTAFLGITLSNLLLGLQNLFLAEWVAVINTSFISAAAFVFAGALMAPTLRSWPAWLLSGIQASLAAFAIWIICVYPVEQFWLSLASYIVQIFGSIVGALSVVSMHAEELDKQKWRDDLSASQEPQ